MPLHKIQIAAFSVLLVSSGMASAFVQPDALQKFELDSLRVWSVRHIKKLPIATVVDPDGYLHTIIRGNKMGRDQGIVTKITFRYLVVKEIRCVNGEWAEVKSTIPVMPYGSPLPNDNFGKIELKPRQDDCH